MDRAKERLKTRIRVHQRIRRKIQGTADRPRLAVHRSLKHIYVQAIDDAAGRTLAAASSKEKEFTAKGSGASLAAAKEVGSMIAARVKAKGIEAVVFDRGGFPYHGRIKALADAAREKGLKF